MNRRRVVGMVFVAVMVMAASAWAQEPGVPVDFGFVAAGKVVEAGTYSVSTAPNGNVLLTSAAGGTAIELPPIKQISKRNVDRPQLVFDLVGSVWFVSEAWLPGQGGYQVASVETSQSRKTVKAPKAK